MSPLDLADLPLGSPGELLDWFRHQLSPAVLYYAWVLWLLCGLAGVGINTQRRRKK